MKIARVFCRKTSYTPIDENAFIGGPPLGCPQYDEIHISTLFTWDIEYAYDDLKFLWSRFGSVKLGGPAFDDSGGEFEPGFYVKRGITMTSRGCCFACPFCFVPRREGKIRTLAIQVGNIVQDNNLLACSRNHIEAVFEMLKSQKAVELKGGLDCRLLKSWHIKLLCDLPSIKNIFLAFDDPKREKSFMEAARLLTPYFDRHKLYAYVLIGYEGDTIEDADKRCRFVWDCGLIPFAMLYCDNGKYKQGYDWRKFQKAWCRPASIYSMMKNRTEWNYCRPNGGCSDK
jgi:hypothetical protein